MTKTPILLAVALGGCASMPDAPPEIETVVETTQAVTWSSTVTTRGLNLTANILADWGNGKQMSAALIKNHTLRVKYCAEHFPPDSPQLANLTAAIAAYNGIPGVAIELGLGAASGTSTHPDLATFTLPTDAIYVDYSTDLDAGVFAATSHLSASCDSSSPAQCTQAHLYVNGNIYIGDDVPSKGVFMHELGHAFGMSHINRNDDALVLLNPQDMWFDRTTIHGLKHDHNDERGLVIETGTLAFLRNYYADTTTGTLGTDEIVAHHNMSVVGDTIGAAGITVHYEWDPAKAFAGWGQASSLVNGPDPAYVLNDIKLRWNSTLNGFEPCSAPGTVPHWFARMSETSTNTVDTPFDAVFEVSADDAATTWTQVASRTFDSYVAGQAELRQIDWDRTFALTAAAFGVASTGVTTKTSRQLRFRADANNALTERNKANNDWSVNVCLYPSTSTCAADCPQ